MSESPKSPEFPDEQESGSTDEDDDDVASQTTEDDPQIPQAEIPPPSSVPQSLAQTASASASSRENPNYRLRYTLNGHTKSLSAVKFSPDGTLLASCGTLQVSYSLNAHN